MSLDMCVMHQLKPFKDCLVQKQLEMKTIYPWRKQDN